MTAHASALAVTGAVHALPGRPAGWRERFVAQPVAWPDGLALRSAERYLANRRPLVRAAECRRLADDLAAAAGGRALVLQAGPCVESFRDEDRTVDALVELIRELAGRLGAESKVGVVTIARLAGQYAKPRSSATEDVAGQILPVFRGHGVNDDAPTVDARRPDPARLVEMYWRSRRTARRLAPEGTLYTSHEALLLEYEEALTRRATPRGEWFAGSAHMLWVGDRTRDPDGAHIAFLSEVANPVAVKLGPTSCPDEVVAICRRLNPNRRPGRLTLVTRLGAARVQSALPDLIAAVSAEAQPVTWLCDPMHGNTRTDAAGGKFRRLCDLLAEARATLAAHRAAGSWFGGLHLELTADAVEECVEQEGTTGRCYTSLCDPRLNPDQARRLVQTISEQL
jgi:3-deoxy-7-phosphoheptulonate synthase